LGGTSGVSREKSDVKGKTLSPADTGFSKEVNKGEGEENGAQRSPKKTPACYGN